MAVLATVLVFSLCYADDNASAAGDANGDCMVNLIDAIELLQGRVPCEQDCPCCAELGDVNGDGRVNELDGVYLLQHLFNHAPLSKPEEQDLSVFALSKSKTIVFSALLAS